MVRPIIKDPIFLSRKSAPAGLSDLPVAMDLLETLQAHRDECVGMAANMIGVAKRIIVFQDGPGSTVMLNPELQRRSDPYETEEGCLSLPGTRKTTRCRSITVSYQDLQLRPAVKTYTGFTAQIIQHEIDHLSGILI